MKGKQNYINHDLSKGDDTGHTHAHREKNTDENKEKHSKGGEKINTQVSRVITHPNYLILIQEKNNTWPAS